MLAFIVWLMLLMGTAVPNRNYGIFLFWLAALICTYLLSLLLATHWSDQDLGYLLGMFIVVTIGLGAGLLIAIAQGLYVWWAGREAREQLAAWGETPTIFRGPLFLIGTLIALFVALQLRSLLQGREWAWLSHGFALAFVVAAWIFPLILPKAALPSHPHTKWVVIGFRWSLPILIAGLTAMLALVAQRAEEIAAGRPYCIQVADVKTRYQSADTLLHLSGLTMRSSPWQPGIQHHAILRTSQSYDAQLFHWSYRKLTFVPNIGVQYLRLTCTPQESFVRKLPWIFAD
ncbi:MAG: hypothetical protein GEU87_08270 [Alphaproteobacteria bacterium]|nr:hypothetical protein [Alphaproteobacteria bacterium]